MPETNREIELEYSSIPVGILMVWEYSGDRWRFPPAHVHHHQSLVWPGFAFVTLQPTSAWIDALALGDRSGAMAG